MDLDFSLLKKNETGVREVKLDPEQGKVTAANRQLYV
jgi:hypothetical protein